MNVRAEVEQHHDDLARWLGDSTDSTDELLERFSAAHHPDFTLVTVGGDTLGLTALVEALAGARHAVPGLRITIEEFGVVAESPELVVCRFLERHSLGQSRRVTAVLVPHPAARHGLRWLSVHETATG